MKTTLKNYLDYDKNKKDKNYIEDIMNYKNELIENEISKKLMKIINDIIFIIFNN